MHPDQARAHIAAWENKERRADSRNASLQYIIAVSQDVRINNRKVKFSDFMPPEPSKKKQNTAAFHEAAMRVAAIQQKAMQSRKTPAP